MNWIDSHGQVNKGVTVESCRINCLLFADDSRLLASSEQGLQYALDWFAVACDQAGMKISTETAELLCFSEKPSQYMLLTASSITLQEVEKFKYQQRYS